MTSETTPFARAILPLIFLGYPNTAIRQILSYHWSYRHITQSFPNDSMLYATAFNILTKEDLPSICHIADTSPRRSTLAAEVILGWLFDQVKLSCSSPYPTHTLWLRRTKAGKHIATGASRLASALHAKCVRSYGLQEDMVHTGRFDLDELSSRFQFFSMGSSLNIGFTPIGLWRRQNKLIMAINLLDSLPFLLPKAGFSGKLLLYSKRAFPRNLCLQVASRVHRARKCLDDYGTRVQDLKLKELGQRIENGE